jgi:tRNA threonylcarbamoyladenosine biosynthesis protein TsaB
MEPRAASPASDPATVLALDTTTAHGSASLWRHGRDAIVAASDPARAFGEQLPGLLLSVLEVAGIGLREVDLFAVTRGPGSLTGMRVGIATIQGLALATGRCVVPLSALDALASAVPGDVAPERCTIAACMDAFRGEVYTALYRAGQGPDAPLTEIEAPAVGHPGDVVARWAALAGDPVVVAVGDGAATLAPLLAAATGTGVLVRPAPLLADTVARLARARALAGGSVLPHAVHPLYLRRPDAETARERAAAGRERG